MPKPSTFPTLYDDLKTVSISFLSKHGYLKPDQWQSGTITWSRGGNKTGSITIWTNTYKESPYLELDYKSNGTPINYRVQPDSIPSNLGKGFVRYFICPSIGKRCRKLYLASGYFVSRFAFKDAMYEKQTYSHKSRKLNKIFETLVGTDKVYEQIYSKHFKKKYKGKTTKRYLKLLKQIEAWQVISEENLIIA